MSDNGIRQITISFADGTSREVDAGTSLRKLAEEESSSHKYPVIAARVNNDIRELTYKLEEDSSIEFLDQTNEDGMRIYRRSLYFIMIKAVNDIFPERYVVMSHAVSKGLYCEVRGGYALKPADVELIEKRMRELVEARIPFIKREIPIEKARKLLHKSGRMDRYQAAEHRNKSYVTIYNCDGYDDYFYGYMAPDTGYINVFSLIHYAEGFIIMFPEKEKPEVLPEFEEQKKLFNIFVEYKRWNRILGVENVGALNDIVAAKGIDDLIRVAEALHEKKIARIADMIADNPDKKRIVLISGPSSSGKTTFAHRLAIQLQVNGLKPITISLDDYFVNRELTPKDESGEYDFEALEAIDAELFNRHLNELICGNEVEIPIYSFTKGSREDTGRKLCMRDDQILIIEGIHGLNEKLSSLIPRKSKFKIYVSALTSMNIDDHNRIPTTDARILRRIVRDYQYRGSSAVDTLKRWPSVRRGEQKNIFPFQEEADVMFNSSLIFELGVLKTKAEPILEEVDPSCDEYSEARRLLEFLSYFLDIDPGAVPANSILREFIGGSCFY